jgi:hypothetical protein
MGHEYTAEEIKILDENTEEITDKWNEYVLSRLNGNGDVHNPPALNRAITDILENVICVMAQNGEISFGIDVFAGFASNMFAFGQWAGENGLNIADLFRCNCETVSDEEIASFLKNHQDQ